MSDIIDFAKVKQKREELKLEQLTEEFENDEQEVADLAVTATMEIVDAFMDFGYPIQDKPECIKDILALIESIRALGYRAKDLESPIHDINNTVYGFVEDEAELLNQFLSDLEENLS